MSRDRRVLAGAVAFGAAGLVHAAFTWPPAATAALFGGGGALALLAEAVAVRLGWVDHHVGPQLRGVPLYAPFVWTGTVYLAFRAALAATGGWPAVALAAGLATAADAIADPYGTAGGYWTFVDDLPGPRYRGVPWWNAAGWFGVSTLTTALALPFL